MIQLVALVRSLAYTLVFYVGSVFYVVAAAVMIPFSEDALIAVARGWAQFNGGCARWLLGIRVRVEGTLPQTGAIVAFKHESFFETTEVLRLFDRPAVVFKAELLRIPLWGRVALAHGVIPVAREAGAAALRTMLTAARRAVAAGRPIVIFPEGTRTAHGARLPIRPGVVGLQKALQLPIVPVALDSGRLWRRTGLVKYSGVVTMRVGTPIAPGQPREIVEAELFRQINLLNR